MLAGARGRGRLPGACEAGVPGAPGGAVAAAGAAPRAPLPWADAAAPAAAGGAGRRTAVLALAARALCACARVATLSRSPASRGPRADLGAAYGTAKAGVGLASLGVMDPSLVMRNVIPVVMAGILGIYGLIVSAILNGKGAWEPGGGPCCPWARRPAHAPPPPTCPSAAPAQ